MISSLAEAGALLGEPAWIDAAVTAAEFLLRELRRPDGRWYRSWHAGGDPRARHDALAADHAALVDAFTRLAEATGEARWIAAARDVADTLLDRFWDPDHGGVFTTPDDGEALVARQKDLFDNATPAANSIAAVALLRLAALTGEARYANHADRILQLLGAVLDQAPGAFSHALAAVALRLDGITEVAVVGDRPDLLAAVRETWRPEVVLAWGERYDSPLWESRADGLAYVCRQYACGAPQGDVDGLRAQLAQVATGRLNAGRQRHGRAVRAVGDGDEPAVDEHGALAAVEGPAPPLDPVEVVADHRLVLPAGADEADEPAVGEHPTWRRRPGPRPARPTWSRRSTRRAVVAGTRRSCRTARQRRRAGGRRPAASRRATPCSDHSTCNRSLADSTVTR